MKSIIKIVLLLLGSFLVQHPMQAQVNVALNKRASQSSMYTSTAGSASNAVDGKTDGRWQSGSVTHTNGQGENNPWWSVDLGEVYEISRIRIWNRTDCCAERLDNFKILVKSQSSGESWRGFVPGTQRNTGSNPLSFEANTQARYVMIQLSNPNGILSLAEVEVYGTKTQTNQPSFLAADTNAIWTTKSVNVCWRVPGFEVEKKWVREAVEESWEMFGDVDFTGWGSCTQNSKGVWIDVIDTVGSNPHVPYLGLQNDVAYMELNFTFNNWSRSCKENRKQCIKSVAIHEFGHVLGFAHEHNRLDCGCDWKEPQGTDPNLAYTPCDVESVMNYCADSYDVDGSTLSPYDVIGLQRAYGKPSRILLTDQFSRLNLQNDGLTRVRFTIKHSTHGTSVQTVVKELTNNTVHTITLDYRSVLSVNCEYLEFGTWYKSFYEELHVFDGPNDDISYRVKGGEAWRTDIGPEVKVKTATSNRYFFSEATMTGYAGCNNIYQGSFWDIIDGGTCWTCPAGSVRTVFSVKSDKACEVVAHELFAKAAYKRKGYGIFGTDCNSGEFWDPNGNCYTCPSGYNRTAYPVTDYRACSKLVPASFSKAIKRGNCCCEDQNSFEDVIYGGTCWSCPEGYERDPLVPVTDPEACKRNTNLGPAPNR